MEITSFYPLIPTEDIEATQATYEALGFKLAHTITDPDDENKDKHKYIIMKNDNGLRLAIIGGEEIKNVRDMPGNIWMNVRDFDATRELLKERGYTENSKVFEFKFMKTIAMRAPEGSIITVAYHKREHDED